MTKTRIAITGMGAVTPLGLQTQDLWEGLNSGRCGITRIKAFDPSGFPCQIAGQVPDYMIRDYIPKSYRKAAKLMCRDIELAVIAADHALRQSGWITQAMDPAQVTIQPERFGVNLGAGLICCDLEELAPSVASCTQDGQFSLSQYGRKGLEYVTPLWLLKYLPNMLACHISILHDLRGPSNTITCAEASSHLAISEAAQIIQRGDSDFALAGAAEAKVNAHTILRQNIIHRATEQYNDEPEKACRPFDAHATGCVFGEGAGLLVLENMERAESRGAHILAELAGTGQSISINTDLRHLESDGKGIQIAVEKALDDAGIGPDELDLIIPHGTGIPLDDLAESRGLAAALGAAIETTPVWTTKGQISNTGAAAGGVDAVAAIQALGQGRIPASANFQTPAAGCRLRVLREPLNTPIRHALCCSYTFGGHTTALVLKNNDI
jgi:3-oxoacyl-[acyl-carrier-protein] synthase II